MFSNKEYIQPQWILDCINNAKLLPIADYEPGKKLPPHISPFYEFSEDGHLKVNKKIREEDEEYRELPPVNPSANNNKVNEAEEDEKLKEMLISKNKKRLLNKLKEEQSKKKKVLKVKQ
jgi:pescadillo protein